MLKLYNVNSVLQILDNQLTLNQHQLLTTLDRKSEVFCPCISFFSNPKLD